MAEGHITQAEAEALMAMEKSRINDDQWNYPTLGGSLRIPLISVDGQESFSLDVWRARIVRLVKGSYQNRARQVAVLTRLDFGGPPHRNPNGEELPCPHLHLYREGYGDKWAFPIPPDDFPDVADVWRTLEDFMRYCHITQPPIIERGLLP